MPNRNQVVSTPDPQFSNLSTPVNGSGIIQAFISNLPIYREGLSPQRRGLEVGMAHGYFLLGPFTVLGPLRDTGNSNLVGLLATIGLIAILTVCVSLYASVLPGPLLSSVAAPKVPSNDFDQKGWNEYNTGFLIGGIGGAAFAYLLLANLPIFSNLSSFN